ncbi:MAG: peptidyl-prolyl cis-trans isomerase, partial [Candidatus Omnitrophica bacterium]|nr:peptidyl-prolyl cis-trans isomerase [Candidatus Omnitrophota bacterium]
ESSAIDFMTLLWKADKEKIEVEDKEVILYVKKIFFPQGKFDKPLYVRYVKSFSDRYNLSISIRDFEEYLRQFIKINKLFTLNTDSEITDEELKKIYILDTQKAKISYLGIPYKNFEITDGITLEQITEFYEKNNDLFKVEQKINIRYILVEENNNLKDEIIKKADKTNFLQELSEEFSLPIIETGLIGINDPIKDIGWQPEINKIAFTLEKNKIGPIISSNKGTLLIEKKESKEAYIPDLKEIESEVKEKMIKESAKIEAKKHVDELLKNLLNSTTNFTDIAKQEEIEIKEPPEFKYYDYIDGLGLDEKISEIVFSLEKNQFYPETLLLHNGAYIIKLNDKTVFDEKDYLEKSKVYSDYIKKNKEISERMKFLSDIRKEAKIKTFSILR